MARTLVSPAPAQADQTHRKHAELTYDVLSGISFGHLIVRDPDGVTHEFGTAQTEPHATMVIRNWQFYARVLTYGSLGLGESYMDGWWAVEDDRLCECIGIFLKNDVEKALWKNPLLISRMLYHYIATKPINSFRSKSNVHHHYDLSNQFFRLMLGPSMTYSCGVLEQTTNAMQNTLEAIQARKYDLVCRKLQLQPGDRLLDIGCGWGGLLFHAARYYGVQATGITLSSNQAEWIRARIQNQKWSRLVRVEEKDYREAEGTYDAVASIGMFEHVGDAQYGTFMQKVAALLKPDGKGLLHTIGWQKRTWASVQDAWMSTYIFPGGHLPSLDRITAEMQKAEFLIGHIENFKPHYAETLRLWKRNVDANRQNIEKLDAHFDTRFFRMWDYYLQACDAGFRYGRLQLYQILFSSGRQWAFPQRFHY
ncbi:MAG: methyltransferase, cyclopropane fatty acid synthase [Candidatus Peribacteria bacterium]|nr:methyltransferase, cyclopropane fatty acid synthase [Candidatus Peribacteria bacterium]